MDVFEICKDCPPGSGTIVDNMVIANSKINNPLYKKIVCSVSGGADSDIVLDICTKLDKDKKIDYVWFDTGLEYEATKCHLKYLEEKYGVTIEVYRAIKPIPLTCKEYGQPFLSKKVSDFMSRLQRHGFKWEDKPFDELYREYPKCKVALRWWCNSWGEGSRFNISYHKWLKEFLISTPPESIGLMVSPICCQFAKKDVAKKLLKERGYDLNIVGIRKYEGGGRSTIRSCFDQKGKYDEYRPVFWYTNQDKEIYNATFNVVNSDCYCVYGLKRTGCAGCPFALNFEEELEIIKTHEPKLYKAVNVIFGKSYTYTRMFKDFRKKMEEKTAGYEQLSLF